MIITTKNNRFAQRTSGVSAEKMTLTSLAAVLAFGLAVPVHASDLERQHGFRPGQATTHQLAILEAVSSSEDDFATLEYKKSQFASGSVVSSQGGISAGHKQLAASFGLDPAQYSVAEIVVIMGENEEEKRAGFVRAYEGDDGAVISTQSVGKAHVEKALELFSGPENNRE